MEAKKLPTSIYAQMRQNRWRTLYLLISFPIVILALSYGVFLLTALFVDTPETVSPLKFANLLMGTYGFWIVAGIFVYSLFSYFLGSRMILAFAGAKPIAKKDAPELYRIVENLSIAAGFPKTPDIYIIEDESLNAFATGTGPRNGKVAISRGLMQRLNKQEIEAVMAHEVGHILNRDIRVMLIMVAVIGAVQMAGEVMIRMRTRDSEKGGAVIPILGIVFLTIGVLIGVLTRLAISREREYLADATSAYLTSNPLALASALNKIAGDARIEVLDGKDSMAALCIADPTAGGHVAHAHELKMGAAGSPKKASWLHNLFASHPPITSRIEKLQSY